MMHGLVMDRKAPLYGRAREIVKIYQRGPVGAAWQSNDAGARDQVGTKST